MPRLRYAFAAFALAGLAVTAGPALSRQDPDDRIVAEARDSAEPATTTTASAGVAVPDGYLVALAEREQANDWLDGLARQAAGEAFLEAISRPPEPERYETTPEPQRDAMAGSAGVSSLEPCGGDLPPCWVAQRESGGRYDAVNWGGCGGRNCYGKWQFSGAWAGELGLPADLLTATPEQQDAAARQLWAGGRGCSNWAAC